jgi:hypothetical protein
MGLLVNDMNAYVMGFFLSLSILNVWETTNTLLTRRKKLDTLQCISSISQLMNLILVSRPSSSIKSLEEMFWLVLMSLKAHSP